MDGPLKELVKLEKLTDNGSGKGKSASIGTSLDSLLQSLRDVKDRLEAGTETGDTFSQLSKTVETRKKEVDERQKEIYNSLSRFGKALDKASSVLLSSSLNPYALTDIHQLFTKLLAPLHVRIIQDRAGTCCCYSSAQERPVRYHKYLPRG